MHLLIELRYSLLLESGDIGLSGFLGYFRIYSGTHSAIPLSNNLKYMEKVLEHYNGLKEEKKASEKSEYITCFLRSFNGDLQDD
ncbi:MAG: hypothetical protein N4A49_08335 [Marinifilaceae bacterium]|nr:hypothetical protein [Marinifilaceae bacterium]